MNIEQMKIPQDISNHAKLSIVAPAGAINPQLIDEAREALIGLGFEVSVGTHAKGKHRVFSATEDERLKDFQEALDDPKIEAVFCARGGYGTVQIIDKLDFSSLEKNPKWIIGFSDISVIHLALAHLGIASLHADMPVNYKNSPNALIETIKILQGEFPQYEIPSHPLNKNGIAKGILTGGNLSILSGLRATPFDVIPESRILFLEDLCEDLYHIERLLQNLKLSGVLKDLSGLVIGQFTDLRNDPPFGKTLEEIILDLTKEYQYPIAFNFPSGHVPNNQALVMGKVTRLQVDSQIVTLQ